MRYGLIALLCLFAGCTPPHSVNHLKSERSLYLQNSAKDPIYWYSWGPEALEFAKKNNRMIFLSIGYATCFACKKMQTQTFTDPQVAELLNKSFVAIQVDREERPDLDAYFLNMQNAIMKFGAWPINFILTPDFKPIFATTFLTRPELVRILAQLETHWQNDRPKIMKETDQFLANIKPQDTASPDFEKSHKLIKEFYALYTHQFDPLFGGRKINENFAPKFPINDDLRLLLRYHAQTGEEQALKMVEKTLNSIAQSALFDHIEGGFHRYSISRDWNTPNFEKILTDQANFLNSYIDLYQIKPDPLLQKTIEKTLKYILEQMQSPLKGFYSTQSGSIDDREGFYYTWQDHEVRSLLTPQEFTTFSEAYYLNPPLPLLQQRRTLRRNTNFVKPEYDLIEKKLAKSPRKKLKPFTDKNVVTAENGYLLSALARVAKVWPSQDLNTIVKTNLDYITSQHRSLNGELYRRTNGGEARFRGVLDDYAYLIDALIEYYQVGFSENYLHLARELQEKQNALFYNSKDHRFLYSAGDESFLNNLYLLKDLNIPSGQSMSYWNLLRLARYFQDKTYATMAKDVLNSYPDFLKLDPASYAHILLALDFEISQSKNLIIVGTKEQCEATANQFQSNFFPYFIVSCQTNQSKLPIHRTQTTNTNPSEPPTYYICENQNCTTPTPNLEQAKKEIQNP